MEWHRDKKDRNKTDFELESYEYNTSCVDGIESFVKRCMDHRDVKFNLDDDVAVIVNSCDGAVQPATRHCDRTMLAQST